MAYSLLGAAPGSSIAPQAREAGPLPETGPEQPARSDGSLKVRFVENHLVLGGLRERLQTARLAHSRAPRRWSSF